jgi:predicted amidophosphoribosyltransferase
MGDRPWTVARLLSAGAGALAGAVDLVLPADCAGCREPAARSSICPACAGVLAQAPFSARPSPAPAGLPPCFVGGDYAGPMRELILAYKERGRRALAAPLGDALARVVLAAWPVPNGVLALVPVPATAVAIRARHGDHMLRLARRAVVTLRREGCPAVVATPLRALPKDDSAHLNRDQRALAAGHAFALRPGRAGPLRQVADSAAVAVLDDVLTTGSTLAAVAGRLWEAGVPVAFGVTLAATRLRHVRVTSV